MEGNEKREEISDCKDQVEEIEVNNIEEHKETENLADSEEIRSDKPDCIEYEDEQREDNADLFTNLFLTNPIFESPLKDILPSRLIIDDISEMFQTADLIKNDFTKAFREVTSFGEQIKLAIPSVKTNISDTFNTISDAFNSVGTLGKTIQEALKSFNFEAELKALREQAKLEEETTVNFKTIMLKMDLPPHNDISMQGRRRIVMLYDEKGMEYTKRFVTRYMTLFVFNNNDLKDICDSWQRTKWLEKRMPILKCAIEGHINSYYSLTIPAILAQTEGILVEGMLNLEAVDSDDDIRYIDQKDFLRQFLLGRDTSFSFDKQIEIFYTKTILARFDRGKEVKSDLSRHAILHGGDLHYGTKINSLKAILVFDYIFGKLNRSYRDVEKSKEMIRQRRIRMAKRNPQGNVKGRTIQRRRFKRNN